MLREIYETKYGIFNHDDVSLNRPLALVAKHWSEDTSGSYRLHELLEKFSLNQVNKYFGLSFVEFLELPTEYCESILEVAADRLKMDANVADSIKNELQNLQGKPVK